MPATSCAASRPRRTPARAAPGRFGQADSAPSLRFNQNIRDWPPALIGWFVQNARDLPWRRTLDPYAIWISEIMLQQTQVKTVIPYWERWMKALPDVRALAEAKPERVLKLWEGLGYYTRARNLQKAAQQLLREHGGRFPTDFEAIRALPGIGRYTAGAISSIAFNQPNPILDGNVIRVLTRWLGLHTNARERSTLDQLWDLTTILVTSAAAPVPRPARRPRRAAPLFRASPALVASGSCSLLNQALMELGTSICLPRQPQCAHCPLQRDCEGRRSGHPERFPNLGRRPASTPRYFQAFLIEHERKWLVLQRPANVINARLWEFPNIEVNHGTDPRSSLRQLLRIDSLELSPFRTVRHSITRYRIALSAYRTRAQTRPVLLPAVAGAGRWLRLRDLERLPFASAHRRLLQHLQQDLLL